MPWRHNANSRIVSCLAWSVSHRPRAHGRHSKNDIDDRAVADRRRSPARERKSSGRWARGGRSSERAGHDGNTLRSGAPSTVQHRQAQHTWPHTTHDEGERRGEGGRAGERSIDPASCRVQGAFIAGTGGRWRCTFLHRHTFPAPMDGWLVAALVLSPHNSRFLCKHSIPARPAPRRPPFPFLFSRFAADSPAARQQPEWMQIDDSERWRAVRRWPDRDSIWHDK